MVWNDLKYFLADEYKPKTLASLIRGIKKFWREKVTVNYCNSKINHVVNKVIDRVIELKGLPTGL